MKDFIPFISQPQNILNFLLSEVATGKKYALRENNFMRILILMKFLGYPYEEIQDKAEEFKSKLASLKQKYYQQMDAVVSRAW